MALRDISFFSEDIDFSLQHKQKIRAWVDQTAKREGKKSIRELNFIFCSDDYLHNINQQYLNHDTLTDIITFDNSEQEAIIVGDIFISVERVKENAQKFGVELYDELCRVIIHGLLHLCGYLDKKKEDKALMTRKEDEYLAIRDF